MNKNTCGRIWCIKVLKFAFSAIQVSFVCWVYMCLLCSSLGKKVQERFAVRKNVPHFRDVCMTMLGCRQGSKDYDEICSSASLCPLHTSSGSVLIRFFVENLKSRPSLFCALQSRLIIAGKEYLNKSCGFSCFFFVCLFHALQHVFLLWITDFPASDWEMTNKYIIVTETVIKIFVTQVNSFLNLLSIWINHQTWQKRMLFLGRSQKG